MPVYRGAPTRAKGPPGTNPAAAADRLPAFPAGSRSRAHPVKRCDAVVVGGGHNGLAGAACLARTGWLRLFRDSFGPMPA